MWFRKRRKELFEYLDFPKLAYDEGIGEIIPMFMEYSKYQREVDYETSKAQSLVLTSTAATIGVGWSAFFFGVASEDLVMECLGIAMAFSSMFFLTAYAPKLVDKLRASLDDLGAVKFYNKWIRAKPGLGSHGVDQELPLNTVDTDNPDMSDRRAGEVN